MKRIEYTLTQDLIELNHLLKHTGFADSGGSGGALVSTGVVKVDGRIELRKRNKIRAGQVVQIADSEIYVLAGSGEVAAKPDVKAEKKPFSKPVAKSGTKPAAKHGAKPFTKSGAKPSTKPTAKPFAKSATKPVAKSAPRSAKK